MHIIGEGTPPEPYSVLRGSCPDCGSTRVQHHVLGGPDPEAESEGPEWVHRCGCIFPSFARECSSCGFVWHCSDEPLSAVRVRSEAGAAFALLPVPQLDDPAPLLVDIELLSPDRMVRYLGRAFALSSIAVLSDFWHKASRGTHPELTVPSFQEPEAQLSISVLASSPETVTLEFTVISDLTRDVPEHDSLAFDVSRTSLVDSAIGVSEWAEAKGVDVSWDDEEWDA